MELNVEVEDENVPVVAAAYTSLKNGSEIAVMVIDPAFFH